MNSDNITNDKGNFPNYRIFREDKSPLWEDPSNLGGGKFSLYIPCQQKNVVYLRNLILAAITTEAADGTCFGVESSVLCGIIMCVRAQVTKFCIWTLRGEDEEMIARMAESIKKVIGGDYNIIYEKHENAITHNKIQHERHGGSRRKSNSISSGSSTPVSPTSPTSAADGSYSRTWRYSSESAGSNSSWRLSDPSGRYQRNTPGGSNATNSNNPGEGGPSRKANSSKHLSDPSGRMYYTNKYNHGNNSSHINNNSNNSHNNSSNNNNNSSSIYDCTSMQMNGGSGSEESFHNHSSHSYNNHNRPSGDLLERGSNGSLPRHPSQESLSSISKSEKRKSREKWNNYGSNYKKSPPMASLAKTLDDPTTTSSSSSSSSSSLSSASIVESIITSTKTTTASPALPRKPANFYKKEIEPSPPPPPPKV